MTPERYERLCRLFDQAQPLAPAERAAFLEQACAGDPTLRAELDNLLAQDQKARGERLFQEPCPVNAKALLPAEEPLTLPPAPPAGEPDDALVGRRVGPYLIEQRLGSGGMGSVYRALREDAYRQQVALKVIRPGLDTEEVLRRFRTERQVLADLPHPHIARLLDGGTTDDGRPYLVMEYIDGEPLDRYCEQHQLGTRERVELLRAVCGAVQHAHERGVVHRDLKPGNVLVTADGTPKVTDFGLAKRLAGGAEDASPTQSGAILGTPSYMAPEQAGGKRAEVGAAADVYALGAILYELLTGRPPFQAETPLDTLLKVISDEPAPPSRLRANVPRDIETICLKCLSKEPARRYASAANLAEDLGRFLAGQPIQARPVGRVARLWRWCRRRPLVAALITALVVSLLAGSAVSFHLLRSRQRPAPPDLGTAMMRGRMHAERKEWDQAIAAYSQAIQLDPKHIDAFLYRGDAHLATGNADEALADLVAALRLKPKLEKVYLDSAIDFTNQGEYEKARLRCAAVLKLNDRSGVAYQRRSNANAMLGRWDRAAADYAKAVTRIRGIPQTSVSFAEACRLLGTGHLEGYRKFCAQMVKLSGEVRTADEVFHIARMCVLAPDSGIDPAEAVRLAERAVEAAQTPWHLHALGLAHYRAGQFDLAIQRLRESGSTGWKGNPTNWLITAMAHHRRGQADEAHMWLDWARRSPFPYVHPHEAMTYQILRREAEALVGADPNHDAIKKEMAKLQGTWTIVSHEANGQKTSEAEIKDIYSMVLKGDQWIASYWDRMVPHGTIRLDPTKNPKRVDYFDTKRGRFAHGIYSVEGDTLTICDRKVERGERPKEFRTEPGSGLVLTVLKRTRVKGSN
jgi:uncharacterized protein (TIGR03067 family)